jgi:hypothetical protein
MAEIHNLRRFRKLKLRGASEQQAAENRSRFGRSKSQRDNIAANAELDARRLDAHRRQAAGEPENDSD